MATNKTIIKVTPNAAVVKIWGTAGSATIDLNVDLLTTLETSPIAAPTVHINGITAYCLSASGNLIVRNSKTLWELGNVPVNWRFEGWCDNMEPTSDIVVTLGASGGVIVLELTKKGGFGDEQYRALA